MHLDALPLTQFLQRKQCFGNRIQIRSPVLTGSMPVIALVALDGNVLAEAKSVLDVTAPCQQQSPRRTPSMPPTASMLRPTMRIETSPEVAEPSGPAPTAAAARPMAPRDRERVQRHRSTRKPRPDCMRGRSRRRWMGRSAARGAGMRQRLAPGGATIRAGKKRPVRRCGAGS